MANFFKRNKTGGIDMGPESRAFRFPYVGVGPKDYQLDPALTELQKELDEHLDALLKGEAVDAGNATVLDNLIIDTANRVIQDLNCQQAEHSALIHNLESRWTGDAVDVKNKITEYRRLLDETDKEIAWLKQKAAGGEPTREYEP